MVRFLKLFLILLLPAAGFCKDPEIYVDVDNKTATENRPITVMVSVTRDNGLRIDSSTFSMGDLPIQVEQLGESRRSVVKIVNGVKTAEDVVITNFQFQIEGRKEGLYTLPNISVEIEGRRYLSPQISFQVTSSVVDNSFRLENHLEGAFPLYPGQKFKVIYKIFFEENIDITRENFVLLDRKEFKKVGEVGQKRWASRNGIVLELSQEYQALDPGEFSFPGSEIEGYAYELNFFGGKAYKKSPLKALSKGMTISVSPFPDQGKPSSFNGALGVFDLEMEMLSPKEIRVGDKIELQIDFFGSGDFSTVKLPKIACQPGFNGNYRFSDLPSSGTVIDSPRGKGKRFVLEIRPLSSQVEEIPEISFSSFDPATKRYHLRTLEPIAIEVEALASPPKWKVEREEKLEEAPQADLEEEEVKDWEALLGTNSPIEIKGNERLVDRTESWVKAFNWNVLYILPLGSLLILFQYLLKSYLEKQKGSLKKERGKEFLATAMKRACIEEALIDLKRAFLLRLEECNLIPKRIEDWRELKDQGITGEVKRFISQYEEKIYSGEAESLKEAMVDEGKKLFVKVQRSL